MPARSVKTISPADVVGQLEAWARSTEGGDEALASMRRSVPFVRVAYRSREVHALRRRVDDRARRVREPWTLAERRQVMADMRAGVPTERTALELSRRVGAVEAQKCAIRREFPEYMWKPKGERRE